MRVVTSPERAALDTEGTAPLGIGVVGYGYWGPNLVRNVRESSAMDLRALCERDPARGEAFATRAPEVLVTTDLDEMLADPEIDAVVVATPPSTHHEVVMRALLAGKHVLVEKPLATNLPDAWDLATTAQRLGLVVMPGHTFVYSPAVNAVRDLVQGGVVGDVHFVTSSRMNLGKYQRDGVVCDLAPHDLSILMYWLDEPIVEVAASGRSVFATGVHETAFLTLTFASGTSANVQLSWLAPRKVRQMIVVGSRRMVQYDDTAADEPVRVYDRGMDVCAPTSFGEHQLVCRSGDIVIPRVEAAEPLALELADFVHAIHTGEEPKSNVRLGLSIVAAIDAAQRSMAQRGAPIAVGASAALAA